MRLYRVLFDIGAFLVPLVVSAIFKTVGVAIVLTLYTCIHLFAPWVLHIPQRLDAQVTWWGNVVVIPATWRNKPACLRAPQGGGLAEPDAGQAAEAVAQLYAEVDGVAPAV